MGDASPAVDLGARKHAVDLAVGRWHTCAQLSDGTLRSTTRPASWASATR
jgi:hypothetical protein